MSNPSQSCQLQQGRPIALTGPYYCQQHVSMRRSTQSMPRTLHKPAPNTLLNTIPMLQRSMRTSQTHLAWNMCIYLDM